MILRKRYFNECPVENEPNDGLDLFGNPEILNSPGSRSGISEHDLGTSGRLFNEFQSPSPSTSSLAMPTADGSPYKEPPPYKPPPRVMLRAYQNQEKYGECVDEFKSTLASIGRQMKGELDMEASTSSSEPTDAAPRLPPKTKTLKDEANYTKQQMVDVTPTKSMQLADTNASNDDFGEDKENISEMTAGITTRTLDKQISVKEATKKFNRIASEEEANKIISPTAKKKPEKVRTQSIISM